MAAETDLSRLMATMQPTLSRDLRLLQYEMDRLGALKPRMLFVEAEGLTDHRTGSGAGRDLAFEFECRMITVGVH